MAPRCWATFTAPPQPDGTAIYTVINQSAAGDGGSISDPLSITIDTAAPQSAVHLLPASVPAGPVSVSWAGADTFTGGGVGSGISSYDVYVSDDNGPFTLWLAATALTLASYTATEGHSYQFYTRARDRAGNLEAAPASPDANTIAGTISGSPPEVLSVSYDQGAPAVPAAPGRYIAAHFDANVKDSLDLSDVDRDEPDDGAEHRPLVGAI
jgi:hypothetical protein